MKIGSFLAGRRRRGVAAAAAVLLGSGLAFAVVTQANAATGCSVTYQNTNAWQSTPTSGGFNATLAITNLGDPITHWTLTFTMPSGQTRTGGWNATYTGSTTVSATDIGWNGAIGTNQTNTSVGIQGDWTRAAAGSAPPSPFPQPTNFALNGVACTGSIGGSSGPPPTSSPPANRPPTVSLTSPAAGATFTAPATINFAATASDPDGTVARVEFLSGSTVVGTDTTSPYAFTWTGVAAGAYSLSARATDDRGASTTTTPISVTVTGGNAGAAPALHVSGNRLLTASGATYRLLGVNRSGGEFACIQGNGMWDGPMDQASINAMRTWKVRAVRVPLNEECWLGNGVVPAGDIPAGGTQGAAYQQAVVSYVNLLVASGITPIVEVHWTFGVYNGQAAGSCPDRSNPKAACQKPMPDAQFAPQFWTSVANTFKGNNAVMFDLFNEPFPDFAANFNTQVGWTCWRDGGTCTGIPYQVAGFQSLVNAVRATGAANVIMIGGLAFSNDASQWLQFKPTDSTGNLMAFGHVYNFNSCSNTSCYDNTFGAVAAQVPIALTEIGENDCAHSFIDTLMNWADSHGVGYLGWTWNADFPCASGPGLITDYNGTATAFGQGLKDRLATVSN
jgi:endoglucanase